MEVEYCLKFDAPLLPYVVENEYDEQICCGLFNGARGLRKGTELSQILYFHGGLRNIIPAKTEG